MRVQVEVTGKIKAAAEAQAVSLGYPSLATMLRVVTAGLARDYQEASPTTSFSDAPGTKKATQAALPQSTLLPPPEQFAHWPPHLSPELAHTDPALYRLLIETGQVW